jgi:GNAT superfamily N-acetyltransferase
VFVLEERSSMVGFYELRDRRDHVELLRMFLQPDLIGRGYGRMLLTHAVKQAAAMSDRMLIMADPSSVGFYRAEGANLERHQEVVPGFVLGVYWYDLTQGAARHQDSGPAGPGTTAS